MKNILLTLLALPFLAIAQNEKGVKPVAQSSSSHRSPSTVRAVVIGISDYQEKEIPDLRFAHLDAAAFANFLRSPAGGSLDNDHLQVLTNQNATAGQVAAALDALIEQAKEGDEVIIYFSGHGDVERKTVSQPGFLLCWDAPARVYMGGGTYSLAYLQEIVTTLSTQNKAKVLVVTDACHAGKLAGNQIGGSQLTAANLAKQFSNEVKILSCQPGELSLEGEQWGGGRGVFSFHLVEGLFGLADKNSDGSVTLGEIDRYLEDNVTAEAAPQSQIPMLLGNKTERLAAVNAQILADLKKSKAAGLPVFAATEGRGFEDEILAKADSSVRAMYFAFKKAVLEKRFFPVEKNVVEVSNLDDVGQTADELYTQLSQNQTLAPLHGMMRRNYAAALQDDAQQTLNEWLKTNQNLSLEAAASEGFARLPQKVFKEKVRSYPRCLDRAAELLGSKHYMYAALKARRYFFEGYLLANSDRNPNAELGERALALFRQSLHWQPEQPHAYWQMSMAFGYNLRQPDSLEHYARLASMTHPNWTQPFLEVAFCLSFHFKQHDRARPFLEQASRMDSSSGVLYTWGVFYLSKKKHAEAETVLKKASALDSTNSEYWSALGYVYLDTRRLAEAEAVLKKAIALDSTYAAVWNNLGGVYFNTHRYAEAETVLKKAIALHSTQISSWSLLGQTYYRTQRYAEAETILKKTIAFDSTSSSAWNNLGMVYFDTRRYAEAELIFKKSIDLDSTYANVWNNLGATYHNARRYAEAELAFKKSMALDSTDANTWYNLGTTYYDSRRYAEAESAFNKAIALDSTYAPSYLWLGKAHVKTNRGEEARRMFLKVIAVSPNARLARLGMATLLAAEGKPAEALDWVAQAIEKGGATFEFLHDDEDLAPLRALPEWKALMKKHFPEKVKD